MKKWMDDFAAYAKSRGSQLERTYSWYTTCPKCAVKHGHNYVVLIGEVKK
jgi:6-pyruvoyl-tetrahydropterin synthase